MMFSPLPRGSHCRLLNTGTGEELRSFGLPPATANGMGWGYTALVDGRFMVPQCLPVPRGRGRVAN